MKKVLSIRRFYLRNKGFTLIELILAMAISSLIVLPLLSLLNLSNNSCTLAEEKDELMLNANFAIDYVKFEIKSADRIISSDKIKDLDIKYPTNIGFVIRIDDSESAYRYITYYTNKSKLVRIACERATEDYPKLIDFSGFNEICEFTESIDDSRFNGENSIISLDFYFNNNGILNIKSDIYVRCNMDY